MCALSQRRCCWPLVECRGVSRGLVPEAQLLVCSRGSGRAVAREGRFTGCLPAKSKEGPSTVLRCVMGDGEREEAMS